MKYFKGTLEECQALVQRLDNFYGLPTRHTLTFYIPEEYNDEYIVRVKDKHYNDLTNEEKSKVEDLNI
tara:strand:- start:387 stop:590 length:204 start_codon:yes stop_codon:yes gene_type:complete